MVEIDNTDHTKFEVVSDPSAVNIHGTITGPHSDLEMRNKVVCCLRELMRVVQSSYHEDVVELNFIQSGSLLIEFYEWRRKKTQELMQALCSGHLDPEDLSLVSDYMSGHVNSDAIFPPNGAFPPCLGSQPVSLDNDSEDDEDERRLDENSLLKYAVDEVSILKRVLELKRDGLWSIDDSSCGTTETGSIDISTSISLVPPSEPTCRTYSDYMFAEINWLAEDFKRERQWKRVSAKKLALTALKCCRDKSERALKIEKEEVVRIRKMCAFIARMVRDWWRQMDKIVQAKQQVRLTAKRQQAISSHLGQVLETTEEYTRWLTEGITSSKPKKTTVSSTKSSGGNNQNENVSDSGQRILKSPVRELDTSDEEFTVDEVALNEVDDEETIEQEEKIAIEDQHGSETSTAVELEQLAADADCPLEDLLPPGYLEFITSNSPVVSEVQHSSASEVKDSGEPYNRKRIEADAVCQVITCSPEIPKECQYPEKSEETKSEANVSVFEKKELDVPKLEVSLSVKETMINFANKNEANLEIASNTFDLKSNSQSLLTKDIEDTDNEVELANSNVNECPSVKRGSEIILKKVMDHNVNASVMETENNTNVVLPNNKGEETQKSSCQTSACEPIIESTTNEGKNASSGVGLATVSSPFLLSGGNLREYQLVGLSWLVATYDKRLNGILADEMGLGKTIQTISLLAYLACERGVWGPHLIVVPTSVILNWEVEFKRWCPSFKILTYFGNMKERKCKRKGWTKTNAFHVCITSYRLAIQDAIAFKRKKWKYLILDEAQNIKNFKSQRWQTLLTFNSQRRLLLTGTPLQNSLMELWSLMHFLMPNIFQSHRDFQEWFASPITGMIEGNTDHNELLVQRLHKVLRPFLLRRLKADVERQLPKKYEHVIMCRLSRRQRFLYDDFMSLGSTQETLKSGQFLSVMNILMQLRKVCNHPNLFETRPIISPFRVADSYLTYSLPRLLVSMSHPFLVFAPSSNGSRSVFGSASAFSDPDLDWLDTAGLVARLLGQTMNLVEMARDLPGFVARRCHQLCARENLITIIDSSDVIDDVKPEHSINLPSLLMAINNMKQPDKNLMKSDIIYAISNILNFGFIPIHNADTQNITRMLILLTNGNIPEKIQHKNNQILIKSDEIIHKLHKRVDYVFSIGVPGANELGVRRLAKPSHYTFTLTELNGYKELDLKNFDPTEVICPVKIPKYCSEIKRLLTLKKPIEKVNGQTAAVNPWYQYAYQQRRSDMRQTRYRYPYSDYEYYYDYGDYNERKQIPVRPVSVPYQKSKTNDEALNAKLIELLYLLKAHDSRQKKTSLVKLNPIITATTTAPTIISTLSPNYYKSLQHKLKSKKFNRARYSSSPISPSYSISDDTSQTIQNEPHTNYSIMMNQSNLNNTTENNCEVKLNKMANLLLKLIEQTLHRNYSSSAVHGNSSINNSSIELLKPASIIYSLNSSQYAYAGVSTLKKGEPLTSINESYGGNKPPLSNDNNNSQIGKQYKDRSYHSTYKAHFQATDWEDSAMHNGAILMFAMKSRSGLSINKMYFSSRNITNISNKNTDSNEITINHTTGDMDISSKMSNSWYKHDLFDQWYSGSYKYVLFELWSNNNPVVQLRFNARYSDKYTWFNKLFLKTSYPWNEYELLEKAKFILTSNEAFSVVFDPNYIVLLSSIDYSTIEKLKRERVDCEFLRGYILIVDNPNSAISRCEWNNAINSKYNNFSNTSNYHDYPQIFYTLPINSHKQDSLNYQLPPKFSNYLFTLYEADELRIYVIPYGLMPSKNDGILLPQPNKLLFVLDTGINLSFKKLWYQEIASPPSAFPLKRNILCHCWYRNELLNSWYKPKTHYHTQNTNHFLTSNLFFGFQSIKIELLDQAGHVKCCLIFDTHGAQVNSWFSLTRLKYSWPWSIKTLTKYNFVQFGDQILTSGKKHYLSLRNWSNFNFWIGKQTLLIEPSSNAKRTTYAIKCLSIFLVYSKNNESDHFKLPECMKGQTNLFKDTTTLTILAFNEELTELNNMKKAQQITIWSN